MKVVNDFNKNVKVNTIDIEDIEGSDWDDFEEDPKFEAEKDYPVSELKNTKIKVPEGMTNFKVLPVNYNRGGMAEVVIAFMTEEGKQRYGNLMEGDY